MNDLFVPLLKLVGPLRAIQLCIEHDGGLLNDEEWTRWDLNKDFNALALKAMAVSRRAYFYAVDNGLGPPPQDESGPIFSQPGSAANAGGRFVGLIRTVLEAKEGSRNHAIYWAACRAAEMVAAKEVTREQVERALVDAAGRIGILANEAMATIRSAFRAVDR